ncbi:hypothetical protein BCR41DRAFT_202332 [Lobosporangium transversale]|uniref:Uncharacterized protein n=1 Tax=Lobosporangium transversale TaxID=64571 RepID=A0A1Y2GXU5_9FUNG|nr:hypothetical protein BCR41DRAFT_202332 [Lobosporangium transversale]ORZ26591.1 hypothetical protein BCR41DRAFT_202332 [Lobosporangium transversale]|eukprot:XP_021884354.1 hypothetical protein BCR41DRAFT_202332 [Lobosporangium transversale]
MSPSTLSSSPSANSQPSQVAPTTASSPSAPAKAANTDWKNSIMSLYGNQSSGSNRHSTGLNISTQQQQQQPGQFGQFGQLQSMKTFGIGQQSSQPQQPQFQQPHFHQSQPQPQQNHWGNNSAFGATLQVASGAPSSFSGFDTFNSTGSNPGFGIQAANGLNKPGSTFGHNNVSGFNSSNNNTNSNINTNTSNVPPGGDLFSMIAGATPSPVTSSSAQNRKNSAFGDLTWN